VCAFSVIAAGVGNGKVDVYDLYEGAKRSRNDCRMPLDPDVLVCKHMYNAAWREIVDDWIPSEGQLNFGAAQAASGRR
jgi:hypothetical protein